MVFDESFWVIPFQTTKKTQNYAHARIARVTRNQDLPATFFVQEARPKKKPRLMAVYALIAPCSRLIR
jgi:hypothetical protein